MELQKQQEQKNQMISSQMGRVLMGGQGSQEATDWLKLNAPTQFMKMQEFDQAQQELDIGAQELETEQAKLRMESDTWAQEQLGKISMLPADQQQAAFDAMGQQGLTIFGDDLVMPTFEQASPMMQQMKAARDKALQEDLAKVQSGDLKDLRNRYEKKTQNMGKIESAYNKILQTKPTAAGDVALVFQFMKMLDPTSTVGPGEQASAQNAAGISEKIINMYNRALTGESMGEKQRSEIREQAKNYYDAEREVTDRELSIVADYAQQSNIPLPKVFGVEGARDYKKRLASPKKPPEPLTRPFDFSKMGFNQAQLDAIEKKKREGWSEERILKVLKARGY